MHTDMDARNTVYLDPSECPDGKVAISLEDNGAPAFIRESTLSKKFKEIEIKTLRDAAEHMAQTTIPKEAADALLLWADASEKKLNAEVNK